PIDAVSGHFLPQVVGHFVSRRNKFLPRIGFHRRPHRWHPSNGNTAQDGNEPSSTETRESSEPPPFRNGRSLLPRSLPTPHGNGRPFRQSKPPAVPSK